MKTTQVNQTNPAVANVDSIAAPRHASEHDTRLFQQAIKAESNAGSRIDPALVRAHGQSAKQALSEPLAQPLVQPLAEPLTQALAKALIPDNSSSVAAEMQTATANQSVKGEGAPCNEGCVVATKQQAGGVDESNRLSSPLVKPDAESQPQPALKPNNDEAFSLESASAKPVLSDSAALAHHPHHAFGRQQADAKPDRSASVSAQPNALPSVDSNKALGQPATVKQDQVDKTTSPTQANLGPTHSKPRESVPHTVSEPLNPQPMQGQNQGQSQSISRSEQGATTAATPLLASQAGTPPQSDLQSRAFDNLHSNVYGNPQDGANERIQAGTNAHELARSSATQVLNKPEASLIGEHLASRQDVDNLTAPKSMEGLVQAKAALLPTPDVLFQQLVSQPKGDSSLQALSAQVLASIDLAQAKQGEQMTVRLAHPAFAGAEVNFKLENATFQLTFIAKDTDVAQMAQLFLPELKQLMEEKFPQLRHDYQLQDQKEKQHSSEQSAGQSAEQYAQQDQQRQQQQPAEEHDEEEQG